MKKSDIDIAKRVGYSSYKTKKQKETILQKEMVETLNKLGRGYFFRVRNGATFDPRAGIFRSNTTVKGIPDIIGYTNKGKIVLIEVKYVESYVTGKKTKNTSIISRDQKEFLTNAYDSNCIVGIAYTIEDAIEILQDDPAYNVRKLRTYNFLPRHRKSEKEKELKELKPIAAANRADPLYRMVTLTEDANV